MSRVCAVGVQVHQFHGAGGVMPKCDRVAYAEILSCFNAYMDADALAWERWPTRRSFNTTRWRTGIPECETHTDSLTATACWTLRAESHRGGMWRTTSAITTRRPGCTASCRACGAPGARKDALSWAFNPCLAMRFRWAWLGRGNDEPQRLVRGGRFGRGLLESRLI